MVNNELYHFGTKGMRWGVRRYQNKDGSLTKLGKRRRDKEYNKLSEKKKKNYKEDPDEWVKQDIKRTKGLADASSHMTNELKRINDSNSRGRTKVKMDLSNMTEQQMRSEINRAILERQYNDMFAPQKVNRGREYAGKALEVTGRVLAIGSSALDIALAIKELRG